MATDRLQATLSSQLAQLAENGRAKGAENVVTNILPPEGGQGPRYQLAGQGEQQFIRMNSNSYLGLTQHPAMIEAEEAAVRRFGTGPGAVRFISGTSHYHLELEERLADFHGRESAMLFSAAYATVVGVLVSLITPETIVLSDALNHNCIINAMRLSRPKDKKIYPHLDFDALESAIQESVGKTPRLIVVTDGVFSMRGDFAPLSELRALVDRYDHEFAENILLVVDDSHGVGALGERGRGTEEITGGQADILIGTLGKAFGVNGGYVVAGETIIRFLRESAPTYIYSNPITPAEAAAAHQALAIVDSKEGSKRLAHLRKLTTRFESKLLELGKETLPSPHPIVPLMVRDTAGTAALVKGLFERGVLATGLNYPVVPEGDQSIRFQINADHTELDIDTVIAAIAELG